MTPYNGQVGREGGRGNGKEGRHVSSWASIFARGRMEFCRELLEEMPLSHSALSPPLSSAGGTAIWNSFQYSFQPKLVRVLWFGLLCGVVAFMRSNGRDDAVGGGAFG